jgi:hypothetical protein
MESQGAATVRRNLIRHYLATATVTALLSFLKKGRKAPRASHVYRNGRHNAARSVSCQVRLAP